MKHKNKEGLILFFFILLMAFMLNNVYSDTIHPAGKSFEIMSFPMPAMTSSPAEQSKLVEQSTTGRKPDYVKHAIIIAQSSSGENSIPAGQSAPSSKTISKDQSVPTGYSAPADQSVPSGQSIPTGQSAPAVQPIPTGQSIPVGQSKMNSIPIGMSKNNVPEEGSIPAEELFGSRGGRFHPFLLLEGIYTDNLFATDSDTKSDFITTAAPGIWLAFPANRAKLLTIDTTTTSPGGLKLSRIKPEATRRYQTYLLYSPEFVNYSGYSKHDHVDHKAEGLFQYNFDSGISFDFIDLFNYKEEIAGNGIIDTLYRHQDNLFDSIVTYETPSGKLKLKFDYSNYDLNYREQIVSYRDRNDNSFSFSLFYKFWPKTSLFGEYDYSIINYDHGSQDDSVENRYYGGVNWDITAKTRGRLKLGYITKDFDSAGVDDQNGFSIELQAQHNLTAKVALQVNGYRKFNESDMSNASSYLSTGIDLALLQRFSAKWSGTLHASYERDEYNGISRNDDLYSLGPAVRFKPKKYLLFDLGADFYDNNSNINLFDYKAYQIFLRITISM